MSDKMSDEEYNKLVKLDKDIWNEAIEDAANIAGLNGASKKVVNEIRKLRK